MSISDKNNLELQLNQKLEIYKIVIESAEKNIERRMRTNQFFFSIVAALFVAYSYLLRISSEDSSASTSFFGFSTLRDSALPIFLLIVSTAWYSTLLSFRSLSRAKYKVVEEIERELPIQAFMLEWSHYKGVRTIETTQLELAIPLLFYLAAAVGLVLPLL